MRWLTPDGIKGDKYSHYASLLSSGGSEAACFRSSRQPSSPELHLQLRSRRAWHAPGGVLPPPYQRRRLSHRYYSKSSVKMTPCAHTVDTK